MIPTKPEDYEVAIPIDKKILKAEVEGLLKDKPIEYIETFLDASGSWSSTKPLSVNAKCTCPKIIVTNKGKKRNTGFGRISNGYDRRFCPIHH